MLCEYVKIHGRTRYFLWIWRQKRVCNGRGCIIGVTHTSERGGRGWNEILLSFPITRGDPRVRRLPIGAPDFVVTPLAPSRIPMLHRQLALICESGNLHVQCKDSGIRTGSWSLEGLWITKAVGLWKGDSFISRQSLNKQLTFFQLGVYYRCLAFYSQINRSQAALDKLTIKP